VSEVVIADTSPLLYLHRVHLLDLLPRLYGRVLVPPAVAAEIEAGLRGGFDIPNLSALAWIEVRQPLGQIPEHPKLHPGEAAAIALALETGLRVLIDDQAGRLYLHDRHHPFLGTLGVIIEAKRLGLVERVGPHLDAIVEHGFWLDDAVRRRVLELAGEATA
jgi:predicted nucleic acid-binding protein